MSIKNFNIEIPKQDYQIISLAIKKDGQVVKLGENDLIFMTVKRFASNEAVEFQKSLDDGISYNEETEKYQIIINSKDTKNMKMNTKYGYDITIFYDTDKPKQRIIGDFVIGTKYTLNEVV